MTGPRRLSAGQEAMWFLYQLAPETAAYNIVLPVHIHDTVDVPVLARAVRALAGRHELLRSVFVEVDGRPGRIVRDPECVRLEVLYVPWAGDDQLRELARKAAARPFRLAEDGPFRAVLLRRSATDAALVLAAHHIAGDFTSLGLILRDLLDAYRRLADGGRPAWPEPPMSFDDYVERERGLLTSPRGAHLQQYWREACDGSMPAELPADHPRPATPTLAGGTVRLRLPDDLGRRVGETAAKQRVTSFVLLLSVFQSLLYHYAGQPDSMIGCSTTTRSSRALLGAVGYFVNTLPLRSRFDPSVTFRQAAAQAQQQVIAGISNVAYPSVLLPAALGLPRQAGRSPLYQIAISMAAVGSLAIPLTLPDVGAHFGSEVEYQGLRLALISMPQQEGQLDLTVELQQSGTSWLFVISYDGGLFEHSTIERFTRHFSRMAAAAVANPDQRIVDANLMDDAELRQLLLLGTGTSPEPALRPAG